MSEQGGVQGGFPKRGESGKDEYSTTGDGHPPRQTEQGYEQGRSQPDTAGQGAGQIGGSGQDAK